MKSENFKKSYSQCGEDLIIDFIFKAKGVEKFHYLDIGCHHPIFGNNTFLFSTQGSRGIGIDASDRFSLLWEKERKNDIFIKGVYSESASSEFQEFFYLSPDTLSTSDKFVYHQLIAEKEAELVKVDQIKTINFKSLIEKNLGHHFELISIDIEGDITEDIREILTSISKPKVLICETISYSSKAKGVKNHSLISYICGEGYFNYADTHINTIFVKDNFWKS